MTRTDHFARIFEENMSESLGVRRPTANGQPPTVVREAISREGPEEGLPGRQAGLIELSRIMPDPERPRKTFSEESLRHELRFKTLVSEGLMECHGLNCFGPAGVIEQPEFNPASCITAPGPES
jgi:hypothetical protein